MAKLIVWLPDSFMVIGIVAVAFGLMLGVLTIRRAISLLGLVVLLLVSGPFVDALFDALWSALPFWLVVPLACIFALTLIRFLVRLVLGSRATDVMVGVLAADAVRWTFFLLCRAVRLPFRLCARKWKSRVVDY